MFHQYMVRISDYANLGSTIQGIPGRCKAKPICPCPWIRWPRPWCCWS